MIITTTTDTLVVCHVQTPKGKGLSNHPLTAFSLPSSKESPGDDFGDRASIARETSADATRKTRVKSCAGRC